MIKFDNLTLYTIEEAAEILPIHYQTIRRYIKSGRLKGRKVGAKWFIDDDSIKALLASSVVSSEDGDEVKE